MSSHIIAVIGAGSGGLTTSIGLAKLGYKVVLIEKHKIGGDCTHYGCVPSKSLIKEAKKVSLLKKELLDSNLKDVETYIQKRGENALENVRKTVSHFESHESREWLESQGVLVIKGSARFIGERKLTIDDIDIENTSEIPFLIHDTITFEYAIISTGSRTYIPPVEGLKGVQYLTNQTVFSLPKHPQKFAIIGNGPIGVELGQSFSRLGSHVTIFGNTPHILPRTSSEISQVLEETLLDEGITLEHTLSTKFENHNEGVLITLADGRKLEFDSVLLATGRAPNTDLHLDKALVKFNRSGVIINKKMQTSNPRIFAVGDVTPVPRFTHMADSMARTLVTNFVLKKYLRIPFNLLSHSTFETVPSIVFTEPEIAQVGLSFAQAQKKYYQVNQYNIDLSTFDRSVIEKEKGVMKVITCGFFKRVVGVEIVASRAGEMLPEFQQIIKHKKSLISVFTLLRAYPSYTFSLHRYLLTLLPKKK